jgi:hypothetical protein
LSIERLWNEAVFISSTPQIKLQTNNNNNLFSKAREERRNKKRELLGEGQREKPETGRRIGRGIQTEDRKRGIKSICLSLFSGLKQSIIKSTSYIYLYFAFIQQVN